MTRFLVSTVVKLYMCFHQQTADKLNLACVWMRKWWTGMSRSKDSVLPFTGLQSPTCSPWSGMVQSQNGSMGSFPGSKFKRHKYLLPPVSGQVVREERGERFFGYRRGSRSRDCVPAQSLFWILFYIVSGMHVDIFCTQPPCENGKENYYDGGKCSTTVLSF